MWYLHLDPFADRLFETLSSASQIWTTTISQERSIAYTTCTATTQPIGAGPVNSLTDTTSSETTHGSRSTPSRIPVAKEMPLVMRDASLPRPFTPTQVQHSALVTFLVPRHWQTSDRWCSSAEQHNILDFVSKLLQVLSLWFCRQRRIGNLVLHPDLSHKDRDMAFCGTNLLTPCGPDPSNASWLCSTKSPLRSRPGLDFRPMFFGSFTIWGYSRARNRVA
jgi:hypothetical protein